MTFHRIALPTSLVLALTALACAPARDLPSPESPSFGSAPTSGLPCDVAAVLQNDCLSCHSATPTGGAPMSLATYADLQKPALSDPSKTVAEVSIERMKSSTRPMPPGAQASAADVAAVEAWVSTGAQAGSCDAAGTPDGGTSAGADAGSGTPPPPAGDTGLPCAVADVLARDCLSCHGTTPGGGAPMSLVTYADLMKPSRSNPSLTYAQVSVNRMQSSSAPMPPGGGASAADVATIANWVSAGAKSETCAAPSAPPPPADPIPDLGNVCTSQSYWRSGNEESSSMNPGQACIACHRSGEGPTFSIAGTVYPSLHEPKNCNGDNAVTVQITDAAGKVVTMQSNSAGNFHSSTSVRFPIRAKVISGDKVREMVTPQSSGDCNACHTQAGTSGAPGRVVAP